MSPEPVIRVTELQVSKFGFLVRVDPTLPTGVVRLVNVDGSGVEYNTSSGALGPFTGTFAQSPECALRPTDIPTIPEHILKALCLELGSDLYPENRVRGARNALKNLLRELGEIRLSESSTPPAHTR